MYKNGAVMGFLVKLAINIAININMIGGKSQGFFIRNLKKNFKISIIK